MSITPPAPDDPFAGLSAAAGATPEVAASKPFEPPGGGTPQPVGLADDSARTERWPVPLLVVLTVAGIAFGFGRTEAPEDRGVTITVGGGTVQVAPGSAEPEDPEVPAPAPPARPQQQPAGGVGDGGSLWKPANLKAALASMRTTSGGAQRITSLRVDTDYLVAEYARGKQRIYVYANRDGRVDRMNTRIGSPGDKSIRAGRIDPTAPDRIRKRIARRARARVANVDYLVLSTAFSVGDDPQWLGYLDQETDYDAQLNPFYARLDGSGVRANGPKARR